MLTSGWLPGAWMMSAESPPMAFRRRVASAGISAGATGDGAAMADARAEAVAAVVLELTRRSGAADDWGEAAADALGAGRCVQMTPATSATAASVSQRR